ncbi:hypothetical protein D3C84_1017870 [compost metagenome]
MTARELLPTTLTTSRSKMPVPATRRAMSSTSKTFTKRKLLATDAEKFLAGSTMPPAPSIGAGSAGAGTPARPPVEWRIRGAQLSRAAMPRALNS